MAAKNLTRLGFLDTSKTAFLACDIQEAFRKTIPNFDHSVNVANRMATAANLFNIPLYVSEQYPKGLGPTSPKFDKSQAVLTFPKTKFSMATSTLMDDIKKRFPDKLEAVVLFGLETHACIEQTAMDFLSHDIAVHILADGCVSRTQYDRIFSLQRMRDIGCHVTTSESVLFKLMKDKDHPKFKEISKLVWNSFPDSFGLDNNMAVSKL